MFRIKLLNGGTITEDKCAFLDIPDMPILMLDYGIGKRKIVRMMGFDSYLIVKENYKIVQGGKGEFLDTINLLGNNRGEIYQFSLNVRKRSALQRKGQGFASMKWDTVDQIFYFGKEQKINPSLWKLGLPHHTPSVEII